MLETKETLQNRPWYVSCLTFALIPLGMLALILACQVQAALSRRYQPAPAPTSSPYPLPQIAGPMPDPARLQLAFIKAGNLYQADFNGVPHPPLPWLEPNLPIHPITITHDLSLINYAWSPDGNYIAAIDTDSIRFFGLGQNIPLIDPRPHSLGMILQPAGSIPALMWTPDGTHLIVWNVWSALRAEGPGWYMINFHDRTFTFEYNLGRIEKMMVLPDGSLAGAMSEYCGEAKCERGLFLYDTATHKKAILSLDDLSQQAGLGALNVEVMQRGTPADSTAEALQQALVSDSAHIECGHASGSPDSLLMGSALSDTQGASDIPFMFSLSPVTRRVLINRNIACSNPFPASWTTSCWPAGKPENFNLKLWDGLVQDDSKLINLDIPGVFTDWSNDGQFIAFQSCLTATPFRKIGATFEKPPWIFVMANTGDPDSVLPISEGYFPSWKPGR
jgi:hypothetical protein